MRVLIIVSALIAFGHCGVITHVPLRSYPVDLTPSLSVIPLVQQQVISQVNPRIHGHSIIEQRFISQPIVQQQIVQLEHQLLLQPAIEERLIEPVATVIQSKNIEPRPIVEIQESIDEPTVENKSANVQGTIPTHVVESVAVVASPELKTVEIATPVVALPHKTQYHAQDELGQASYGHSEPLQTHDAIQDAAGNKAGSYSYVAPDGRVLTTNYVADEHGFRVASNALPIAEHILPVAPVDEPEVSAARAAHLKDIEIVKSRSKRSVIEALPVQVLQDSVLSKVVNTPGHAISYRVDPVKVPSTELVQQIQDPVVVVGRALSLPISITQEPTLSQHSLESEKLTVPQEVIFSEPATIYSKASPTILAQDSVLTKVVNTPGHAISYRVDPIEPATDKVESLPEIGVSRTSEQVAFVQPIVQHEIPQQVTVSQPILRVAQEIPQQVTVSQPITGSIAVADSVLTKIVNTPDHAISYRVDPVHPQLHTEAIVGVHTPLLSSYQLH